jgi:imidazoleglycerol phosphate dehydratase HisB
VCNKWSSNSEPNREEVCRSGTSVLDEDECQVRARVTLTERKDTVTYTPLARQRVGKHVPSKTVSW